MKLLLHKTIVYKGMKYIKGMEVNVDEKDIEELQVYGTLIDVLPVKPLEADLTDEKPVEDKDVKKATTTRKKTTTRKASSKK